jgi:SAM-dependent methyltransferase
MASKSYYRIVAHYEECLQKYGDSHLGVDWPRIEDVDTRHAVMLGIVREGQHTPERPASLLDFGCGASHFYDYLQRHQVQHVQYAGLDLSQKFVDLCRSKYPHNTYYCLDILDSETVLPCFDYVIMNGVFTEKRDLSFPEMLDYFKQLLCAVFHKTTIGISFNVMSKQVEWERDDLFHLSLDILADFLSKDITRHFVIRNDYGLYEYTCYAYRDATSWQE